MKLPMRYNVMVFIVTVKCNICLSHLVIWANLFSADITLMCSLESKACRKTHMFSSVMR